MKLIKASIDSLQEEIKEIMGEKVDVRCKICKHKPDEIDEYIWAAEEENMTPEEYVKKEEGTYNSRTGQFYCTECYIKAGSPLGTA